MNNSIAFIGRGTLAIREKFPQPEFQKRMHRIIIEKVPPYTKAACNKWASQMLLESLNGFPAAFELLENTSEPFKAFDISCTDSLLKLSTRRYPSEEAANLVRPLHYFNYLMGKKFENGFCSRTQADPTISPVEKHELANMTNYLHYEYVDSGNILSLFCKSSMNAFVPEDKRIAKQNEGFTREDLRITYNAFVDENQELQKLKVLVPIDVQVIMYLANEALKLEGILMKLLLAPT